MRDLVSGAWAGERLREPQPHAVADLMDPNHPFAELEALRSPVLPSQMRIYANELQEQELKIPAHVFWSEFSGKYLE